MMDEMMYIRVRGEVSGPYSEGDLRQMVKKGVFSRIHEISDDQRIWRRATEKPELFAQVGTMAPDSAEDDNSIDYAKNQQSDFSQETVNQKHAGGSPQLPSQASWLYAQNDQQIGPVSFTYLQTLFKTGQLAPTDFVWQQGMPDWVTADSVPGLIVEQAQRQAAESIVVQSSQPSSSDSFTRVSGMAVTSLIMGLLPMPFFFGVTSLLAIIFGGVAIHQIQLAKGRLSGHGLAVAGLVLGIVFLAVQIVYLCILLEGYDKL